MRFISPVASEAFFRSLGIGPGGLISGSRTANRFKSDALFYKSRLPMARDVAQVLARAQGEFTECVVWAFDLVWGDRSREEHPPKDWEDYARWRHQQGETRSDAPGHVFDFSEQVSLARVLELAIYMGWDTLVGARPSKMLVELSHHDSVTIHARSRQTELISQLERLGLKVS
jgi:hypothetical protein